MSDKQWVMIVDAAKCEACYNCFLAVKDEHIGNDFPGYSAPMPLHGQNWVEIRHKHRGTAPVVTAHSIPVMCNQCEDAPCLRAATDGAMYRRPDGIVMIDPVKARGQKTLVKSCPYGHIHWNDELELPQKWNFDAHLLDQGWTRTRGEQVCGTGALTSMQVDAAALAALRSRDDLEVLEPQFRTAPRIFYKNLHLMTKSFIAGTVVTVVDGVEDCAEGRVVVLSQNGQEIARATTDAFGEFMVDGLAPNSGTYDIGLAEGEGALCRCELKDDSVYVGVLSASA